MAKKFGSTQYRPNHEDIARRAQEIYLANGSREGSDVENWLQAEAQLLAEHDRKSAPAEPSRPAVVRATRAR
jgi:hypothetical protein